MKSVSAIWNALPEEEREKYNKAAQAPQSHAPPDDEETEDLSAPANDEEETIPAALARGMRQTVSFKKSSDQVANFMDSWIKQVSPVSRSLVHYTIIIPLGSLTISQAVNIAKTCNCEMVFFTVSRHLGPHSFQYTQTTHGASAFVAAAENMDGARHYLA
jgi:hypothetical protein